MFLKCDVRLSIFSHDTCAMMQVTLHHTWTTLHDTYTLSIATCTMMHVDRAVFIYWCELASAMRPL